LYSHNIVYAGIENQYFINSVTWSLEIEVQFYFIAPLISKLFTFGKLNRRIFFISIIIGFPLLNCFLVLPYVTIYNYIQYFIIGFLLADLLVENDFIVPYKKLTSFILGLIAFLIIYFLPDTSQMSKTGKVLVAILFSLDIFIFYYFV
jgi:peptidoglycan/LPS O-acetylase OafA/YrhL